MIDTSSALAPSVSVAGLRVHVNAAVISTGTGTNTVIAQQQVTVTANTTNYIYFASSVTVGTSGFPVGCIPIATAVTNANSVTVLTDLRPDFITGGGGGGTPGGANTQVQFNDAGAFGGNAGLTYNKTTQSIVNTITSAGESFLSTGSTATDNIVGVSGALSSDGSAVFCEANKPGAVCVVGADSTCTVFSTSDDIFLQTGPNELNVIELSTIANDNGVFISASEAGAVLSLQGNQDVTIASTFAHVDINAATGIAIVPAPGQLLSFFTGAGASKPTITGAKPTGVLLQILTALAQYGLVTDSTV